MVKLRHLLPALIISSTLITTCAVAQSFTEIRDTVLDANGSPFTGRVVITWNGFTGPSGGTVSPLSTSAKIYNGALSVLLVPTTTASAGTYYQAVYNSNNGLVTWSEIWQVPPSPIPLTLSQVRQSSNQGGGNGGTTGGGGTGSGPIQFATLPISIDEVTNLSADLASINSSISSLTTQLNNLGLASSTTNAVFVDAETPTGTLNGTNTTFTLANPPSPGGSLTLYRNGLIQSNNIDFTLSGTAITFNAGSIPQAGDILQAYYRIAGTGPTATFSDAEIPGGIADGVNLAFTLAATPNPASSLKLYKNGVLLQLNSDYTLSGSTVTFVNATVAPQAGDKIIANYRH